MPACCRTGSLLLTCLTQQKQGRATCLCAQHQLPAYRQIQHTLVALDVKDRGNRVSRTRHFTCRPQGITQITRMDMDDAARVHPKPGKPLGIKKTRLKRGRTLRYPEDRAITGRTLHELRQETRHKPGRTGNVA